ncbi:MAG: hypothetical protein GTO63_20230 [Anaerolineae bacterium]|nr:hypothetical protein [Anaerolineae bacterium]
MNIPVWAYYIKCREIKYKVCRQCGKELDGRKTAFCSQEHTDDFYRDHYWGWAANVAKREAGGICAICGEKPRWSSLVAHHIIPLNGERRDYNCLNHPENILVLCASCHRRVEYDLSWRWELAAERLTALLEPA